MAKKRRTQELEKEEKEYKPPEFDKKEFMETEINVAKGTIYSIILSVLFGVLAFIIMPYTGTAGGLILGAVGIGLLWVLLPILKVEIESYKPMHWLGIIGSYFFLFLAIWVLLCNPPFSDSAPPDIRDVQIYWEGGYVNVTGQTADIPDGANLSIRANVTDNVGVAIGSVRLSLGSAESQQMSQQPDSYIFEYYVENAGVGTTVTIYASDSKENSQTMSFDLT
jgi:hypothetical protein